MVRVDEYVKHRILGLCAFFVGEKFMVTIICPTCASKVYTYDGKSKSVVEVYCKGCQRLLKFNPETMAITEIGKLIRNTSSGMRFY